MIMNLDKNQKSAVFAEEKNILIVASPGSGKTTVIINRVNNLIEEKNVKIGNIITITFTKSVAKNMEQRYKSIFEKNISPFFGTFHSLFYKILIKEGFKIEIIKSIICNNIVKGVLNREFNEVSEEKVRDVVSDISNFKTSFISIDSFNACISKDLFRECYEAYEKYKEKNNLYDFDDLAISVLNLFKENQNILDKYKNIFKHILVDEFQDCDNIQIEFLKIINDKVNLFAVGDEDQCIYSFRGSKPQYMVDFDKVFENGKKIFLDINYRSKSNIVEVSKKVIKNNLNRNNKTINYFHKENGDIRLHCLENESEQAKKIIDIIKEINKVDLEKVAIVYRTNIESRSIVNILFKHKIPFSFLDKGYNFFDNNIVKDLINYLQLSVEINNKDLLLKVINKPFRYISRDALSYLKNYKYDENPFDILIGKPDITPFQKKKIVELKKDILYLNKISLNKAINNILKDLGYNDYLIQYAEKQGYDYEELKSIVEEFKLASNDFKNISEFLLYIKNVSEEIKEAKNYKKGIVLSTIHGVKGMEFEYIFLINCNEEIIPYSSSIEENLEEERRIFYVAITRAISNLYIFYCKSIYNKILEKSRFIDEAELVSENLKLKDSLKVGEKIYHKTLKDGLIKKIKKGIITIKFNDSIERSFSLELLLEKDLIKIIE